MADAPLYFAAGNVGDFEMGAASGHRSWLLAVNELATDDRVNVVRRVLDRTASRVLIDSGAFVLAMRHVKQTGCTIPEAFATPLGKMADGPAMAERYRRILDLLGSRVWGALEMDLGTREDREALRAAFAADSYELIPVYHPMSDPPEELDAIAAQYDRIAVGGIARLAPAVQKRVMAGVAVRMRDHPATWWHVLGVGPSHWHLAYPCHSCDAVTWKNYVKHGIVRARYGVCTYGQVPEMVYRRDLPTSHPRGFTAGERLTGIQARWEEQSWRVMSHDFTLTPPHHD